MLAEQIIKNDPMTALEETPKKRGPKPKAIEPAVRHVARPVEAPKATLIYKVIDNLAHSGSRTHELMDSAGKIQRFVFQNDETPVEVPMAFALRLIGNDGFTVYNERGMEMHIDYDINSEENQGVRLLFNQVVASYDELTIDALIARAEVNGKVFRRTDGKETIISYLLECRGCSTNGAATDGVIDDDNIELEDGFE